MIKFFRKIRKRLINQNNIGKYFKYAIGEILLVVIGILIALQVNNWNENRKSQIEKNELLASIKKDLNTDVVYLRTYLQRVDSSYQILKEQSAKVNRITYSKDSLVHFLKNEINVYSVRFRGFNNNTYESVKTSGKLNLIHDSIKGALYELSLNHQAYFKEYEALRDDYFDEIENLAKIYPIQLPFSFVKDGPQVDFIWDNLSRTKILLNLNSWGTLKANFLRDILRNLGDALEKTEAILELIEHIND